jgi:hypothetical protein
MSNYTYNSKQVSILVNLSTEIKNYGDGDFVSIEMVEDAFTPISSSDGHTTWSMNPSTLATVTITLMASSPSNDALSALHIADRVTGLGVFPLTVKDNSGRDLFASDAARIIKMATITKGKEIGTREWTISCANSTMFVGGN